MINSWLESKEALPIIVMAGRKTCSLGRGGEIWLAWMTNVQEHTLSLLQGHVHKGTGCHEARFLPQSRQNPRSWQLLALPLASSGSFSVISSRNLSGSGKQAPWARPLLSYVPLPRSPSTGQFPAQKGTHMVCS